MLCTTSAPNLKVGSLIDLAREARHPILIVNDSDISVPPGYIGDVTAPLADPGVGLVTCLYRAEAHDWPSRFEALAIATDFAPSTLVARLFGVSDFGLGSTLAFRKADLDRIGGFRRHRRLYRRRLSARPQTARAGPAQYDFRSGCEHADVIRIVARRVAASSALGENHPIVRGAGYAGLPITYASLWAVVAALFGLWWMALPLLAIRLAMAIVCGWFLLESPDVWKYCYAIPVRDLCGVAVWAAGLFGTRWCGAIRNCGSTRKGRSFPRRACNEDALVMKTRL